MRCHVGGRGCCGRRFYWKGSLCVFACVCACVCVLHSMVSELSQPLRRSQCSLRRRKEALSPKVWHIHIYTHRGWAHHTINTHADRHTHTDTHTNPSWMLTKPDDLYTGHPQLTRPLPCDKVGGRKLQTQTPFYRAYNSTFGLTEKLPLVVCGNKTRYFKQDCGTCSSCVCWKPKGNVVSFQAITIFFRNHVTLKYEPSENKDESNVSD